MSFRSLVQMTVTFDGESLMTKETMSVPFFTELFCHRKECNSQSSAIRNYVHVRLYNKGDIFLIRYRLFRNFLTSRGHFFFYQLWNWIEILSCVQSPSSLPRAAFKIVAASLGDRGAFEIVACFLHHGNSKICLVGTYSLHLAFLAWKIDNYWDI